MSIRLKIFSLLLTLLLLLALLPLPARAASNDSTCTSVTPPTAPVYEGYKYQAVVTMTNTGDNNWSNSAGYRLGSQDSANNTRWGVNRVVLPTSTFINSGQSATFTFEVTVNASPGTYNFSWRMVRDPEATYGFFGETCTASITVLPSPYALYSPLMLKNHPAGYVPDSGKATENNPYYDTANGSNAAEKQWTNVSVNNFDTANSADIRVVVYDYTGNELTNFTKTIAKSGTWNSYNDSSWAPWKSSWVTHSQYDSVVGWAKIVPVVSTTGATPSLIGQQRITITEPKTDANGNPAQGPIHLMTDMNLTSSASATLNGGYFLRNWPAGYPNDSAVVQKTYINITNPNSTAANVTMKIYKTDGTLHHTASKTIDAFGSWYSIDDTIWENIPLMDTTNKRSIGWVEVTSDKPVTGSNRTVAEKAADTNWLRLVSDAPLLQKPSVRLYGSLFVQNHNSGFTVPGTTTHIKQWSYLTLHNPGTTSSTATVKVYSSSGGTPDEFDKTIAGHGTWYAKNDTDWDAVSTGATDGWVEITSTASLVGINRVSIGGEETSNNYHRYWTDYALDTGSYKEAYAGYFLRDRPSGYWESDVVQRSYPYIANPGSSSATVRISVYPTGGGTPTAQWTETIAARSTWTAISDTDWTGTGKIPASLTYGWVKFEVTAGDPIIAMNRVTFAKSGASSTSWLRLMTDAPLGTLPPPTLSVLNVVPDTATLAVQGPAYGRTGLRTTESGSNFYNALQITQKVRDGNINNVGVVGTAFTDPSAPPAGNTICELTKSAYSGNGFVLLYANIAQTGVSYSTNGSTCTGSQSFTAGNYYVYFKGGWSGALDSDTRYDNSINGLFVQIPLGQTSPAVQPQFSATLYTTIGNRSWGTYGYLMDINGVETSVAQRSCPATITDPNSPSYTTTCF